MESDPLQSTDAERGKPVLMLQAPELPFHSGASPVEVAPALRLARDERVQTVGLDPDG